MHGLNQDNNVHDFGKPEERDRRLHTLGEYHSDSQGPCVAVSPGALIPTPVEAAAVGEANRELLHKGSRMAHCYYPGDKTQ